MSSSSQLRPVLLVLLLLASCACLLPSTFAQIGCGGAGFDLTSVFSAGDLSYSTATTTYTVNPCRPITSACVGKNATFCYNTTAAATAGTAASYYQPGVAVVAWTNLAGGVQSYTLNGILCGSGVTAATVQYYCNAAATTPYISAVTTATCSYTAIVQTTAVCGTAALAASPAARGLPFTSNVCGGGVYNLSTLDSTDFNFTSGGSPFWYRPCSAVTTSTCTGSLLPTSFCQFGQYSLGYGGTSLSTTYTSYSGGLLIQIQDGTLCNGIFPRATNTFLVCNASATTPYLTLFTETPGGTAGTGGNGDSFCHYTTIIQTNAVCTTLPAIAQPTPTIVYFSASTAAGVYPAVCTSGSMACTSVPGSTNYTGCTSVVSGTHTYYPSATAPSYSVPLSTVIPTSCAGYNGSNSLPVTAAGLNLQYGQTCLQYYASGSTVRVSPDAVTGVVTFQYGALTDVATCPAPVAAVATGSQAVGFVYTLRTANYIVCGAGSLLCTAYGQNEFVCPTLSGGTQFNLNLTTGVTTSYPLSGEVECNSYGDGFLPLDYEGISFGGGFPRVASAKGSNCTSIYTTNFTSGAVGISGNTISTSNTSFTYTTGQLSFGAACSSYIPAAVNSTATPIPAGFGCGGAGYDLSSISTSDLQYITSTGAVVEINVCRPLSTGVCGGANRNVTFCYGSSPVAYAQPGVSVIAWSTLAGGGIQSSTLNGYVCTTSGAVTGPASANIQYVCNATATTPYISAVTVSGCSYAAVVQTSAVCGTAALAASPAAIGLPFTSNVCGGGVYNLSTLDSTDFNFTSGGSPFWYRPCSAVTTSTCTGSLLPTSFCQYGQYSLGYGGTPSSTTYTVLNNGLLIQIQDGTLCNSQFPRATNTYLVCNASATTPYLTSFGETAGGTAGSGGNGESYCHYTTIIQTNAVCATLPAIAQPAPTIVYFSASTAAGVYPAVCTSGSMSCSGVPGSANYSQCTSVVFGTHTYYPSATAPSYSVPLSTVIPTSCAGYNGSNSLPVTAAGLNLQYGQTCLQYYASGSTVRVSPDAVTGVVTFQYGALTDVATCPAPVAAVATGSQAVGFVYTLRTANYIVCGAGSLLCTAYGQNEFVCPTLSGGTQFNLNLTTGVTTSYPLSGEVECNSYGDGFLPLDYEGISFGGGFPRVASAKGSNCTSIYTTNFTSGAVGISGNTISTSNTSFTYTTGQLSFGAACSSYIPAAINATTAPIPAGFGCGGAGYDLTSISGSDLQYISSTGVAVELNVCRSLSTGVCANRNITFCYGSSPIAYSQPGIEVIQWTTISNGVQSYSLNGYYCSAGGVVASATTQFVCNATATTPIISSVTVNVCSYTAVVQTAAVCAAPLPLTTVGLPYVSNVCGGGVYNLSALDSTDLTFNTTGGAQYWWRPCSAVTTSTCVNATAPTSFCQSGPYSLGYGLTPNSTTYTVLNNGLLMQMQDGTLCNNYFPRETNVYLTCNPAATTAVYSSYSEAPQAAGNGYSYCHYTLNVQTSAVCSQIRQPSLPSSSSSSGSPSSSSSPSYFSSSSSSSSRVIAPTITSSSSAVSSSSSSPLRSSSSSSSSSAFAPIFVTSSSRSSSSSSPSSASASIITSSSSSSTAAPAIPSSSSSSSSSTGAVTGSSSSSSLSGGAIAGIVIGSVVGAALLCVICIALFMFRSGKRGESVTKGSTGSGYNSQRDNSVVEMQDTTTEPSQMAVEGDDHTLEA